MRNLLLALYAWFLSGAILQLLYVIVLERVERRGRLECVDRYLIMRLYRRAILWDEDMASMLIGPIPPLLGFLEILFRRPRPVAPSSGAPAA